MFLLLFNQKQDLRTLLLTYKGGSKQKKNIYYRGKREESKGRINREYRRRKLYEA